MSLGAGGRWLPVRLPVGPPFHPADRQERRPRRLSAQPRRCGLPSRDRGRQTSVRPDRFIAEKFADGSRASGAKVAVEGSDNGPLSRSWRPVSPGVTRPRRQGLVVGEVEGQGLAQPVQLGRVEDDCGPPAATFNPYRSPNRSSRLKQGREPKPHYPELLCPWL
jgi:hypothetical protein